MASFMIRTEKSIHAPANLNHICEGSLNVYVFTDGYTQACLAWAAGKSYYKVWRSCDETNPTVAWKELLTDLSKVTDEQIRAQAEKCVKNPPYNMRASVDGWAGVLATKRNYLAMLVDAGITEITKVDV